MRTGVDPKTVQRWLSGRIPHTRHCWRIANLVQEDETYLWPTASSNPQQTEASRAELVALYPHRADVPPGVWHTLFDEVHQDLGILVYAAVFLPEQQIDLLRAKADAGCSVRIALGDPTSPKLLERGNEEKFGTAIVSRAENALKHYQALHNYPGVEVRVHGTTLYNSIYRFDDVMLVNTHFALQLHLAEQRCGGAPLLAFLTTTDRSCRAIRPARSADAAGHRDLVRGGPIASCAMRPVRTIPRHFGVGRRLENLPLLRDKLEATNERCLALRAEVLDSAVDGGQLAALAQPSLVGQRLGWIQPSCAAFQAPRSAV